jgi:hypothetical protein
MDGENRLWFRSEAGIILLALTLGRSGTTQRPDDHWQQRGSIMKLATLFDPEPRLRMPGAAHHAHHTQYLHGMVLLGKNNFVFASYRPTRHSFPWKLIVNVWLGNVSFPPKNVTIGVAKAATEPSAGSDLTIPHCLSKLCFHVILVS